MRLNIDGVDIRITLHDFNETTYKVGILYPLGDKVIYCEKNYESIQYIISRLTSPQSIRILKEAKGLRDRLTELSLNYSDIVDLMISQ
jgi:hypothetical protein